MVHGMRFNKIVPMATAESNVVQEGEEYIAKLYIVQTSSRSGARMTVNNQSIRVDANGIGQVRLKATGNGKQQWQGTITIPYRGRDSTFRITQEYEVIPKLK
jgi:hypothetical protein